MDKTEQTTIHDVTYHTVGTYKILQKCLICEQTQTAEYDPEIHSDARYLLFICDECKEAIAFIKDLKASVKEVPASQAKEIETSIALL